MTRAAARLAGRHRATRDLARHSPYRRVAYHPVPPRTVADQCWPAVLVATVLVWLIWWWVTVW